MIEAPESESRETLDTFAEALFQIKKEADENPQILKDAPQSQKLGRLNEVLAARQLNVRYKPSNRHKNRRTP